MEARVKRDSRLKTISAFGGLVYSVTEFRPVPEWAEDEARANPYLELKGDAEIETAPAESIPAPLEEGEVMEISATPSALSLAEDFGIDLALVEGTGADGKVIKSDVEKYIEGL